MKHVVGVAEMKLSDREGDLIVTHALGSCLGIAAHDATAGIGGILHVMMPMHSINPVKARGNPCMFVDTGLPTFFRELYALGAEKKRLTVKVAGGANVHKTETDRFSIGQRNLVMLKKVFWTNGVLIKSEQTGGQHARTMYLEVGSGRVWISSKGSQSDL